MVFSDTSNLTGIVEDITFLLGLDTNAFSLKDRTRCVNERYRAILQTIFECSGGWKFMDDNTSDASTGVPYADQTITSGTGLYVLPTGSLTIDGVEIKNSGGTWERLTPISHEDFLNMGGDALFNSNSTPRYYMLQGDVLRLLSTPNYTQAASLRIFFSQDISTFAYTDTTKVPGFAVMFHRMLSVGAALDYAMTRAGMESKAANLSNVWNDYMFRLREFYSKRFKDMSPGRIRPAYDLVNDFS